MTEWLWSDPVWFFALLVIPVIMFLRSRRVGTVWILPHSSAWQVSRLSNVPPWSVFLAYAGIVFLIFALARPQKAETRRIVQQQGYDLMLVVDLSTSMLSMDYEVDGKRSNRWQAIRPIIEEFIKERTSDRIGLVVFSRNAYTLSPLTFDHDWLLRHLARLRIGLIEDGTAIGDGMGLALSRLQKTGENAARQRLGAFVVLLTDGANNCGTLQPLQAAELAQKNGIPVYTIGAGRNGIVPMPQINQQGDVVGYVQAQSQVDEPTLQAIAEKTGGQFFRASDTTAAKKAFAVIDNAKKITFQGKAERVTSEYFAWFAIPGLLCWIAALGVGLRRRLV